MKKSKFTLWFMLATVIFCTVARFCQITLGTDMTSGFLLDDNGFVLDWAYYLLLILTFGGAVALSLVDVKRNGRFEVGSVVDAKAALIGFAVLVMGVSAAYEGAMEFNAFSPSVVVAIANIAFGALTALVAFVVLYRKQFTPGVGFAFVVPALLFMLRGIFVFIERMVITNIPEYLIRCLSVVGLSAFCMLFAKYFSGNRQKHTEKALCSVGVVTFVLVVSNAVAVVLADLLAPQEIAERICVSGYEAEYFYQQNMGYNGYMMVYPSITDIFGAIFIGATLISLFVGKKHDMNAEDKEV